MGVGTAVASFVILVGMSQGLERGWSNSLSERDIHLVGLNRYAVETLTATMDESLAGEMTRIPGVITVGGELLTILKVAGKDGERLSPSMTRFR